MMQPPTARGNYVASHEKQHSGFGLLHEDSLFLVLEKPAGLLAVPGLGPDKQDCLSARVQAQYPEARVVHRLDMATSGLMLMARSADAQRGFSKLFAQREIGKRYVAVVAGRMPLVDPELQTDAWRLIDLPIKADWARRPLRMIDSSGKPSQTKWRVLSYDPQADRTRLELEPLTGRTHQLRVHLRALGHPILGDALYGGAAADSAPRLLLHAAALLFAHPATGRLWQIESQAPF
jgi:tRNA pseudouridine32 synthase / 23S rRNA pseudouridine746 synthase